MKILDEYVIILNILLLMLLLYNLFQKSKIIEGHAPNAAEIKNTENSKKANKKGDNMIQQVADKEKEAEESTTGADKNNDNKALWDKQNKEADERNKKISNAMK